MGNLLLRCFQLGRGGFGEKFVSFCDEMGIWGEGKGEMGGPLVLCSLKPGGGFFMFINNYELFPHRHSVVTVTLSELVFIMIVWWERWV